MNLATLRGQPEARAWLGRGYAEHLGGFCQQSIDTFYETIAREQGQAVPRYFVEKYPVGQLPRLLWELYTGTREIFLARDFRDMVASMLPFGDDLARASRNNGTYNGLQTTNHESAITSTVNREFWTSQLGADGTTYLQIWPYDRHNPDPNNQGNLDALRTGLNADHQTFTSSWILRFLLATYGGNLKQADLNAILQPDLFHLLRAHDAGNGLVTVSDEPLLLSTP